VNSRDSAPDALKEGATGADGEMNLVTPLAKTNDEIGDVDLTTTNRRC